HRARPLRDVLGVALVAGHRVLELGDRARRADAVAAAGERGGDRAAHSAARDHGAPPAAAPSAAPPEPASAPACTPWRSTQRSAALSGSPGGIWYDAPGESVRTIILLHAGSPGTTRPLRSAAKAWLSSSNDMPPDMPAAE